MQRYNYKELEAATGGFSLENLIGKGSHGCVYKATLRGGQVVAVKKVSTGLQLLEDLTKVENELQILSSLPRRCLHFVDLLGVAGDSPTEQRLVIMELMPNGTLHDVLHSGKSTLTSSPSQPRPLTWHRRAVIALEIAKAIDFLHQMRPPVVHRDIKSSNVLFDENWRPRVGDFGLAVRKKRAAADVNWAGGHDRSGGSSPAGTIGYLDPMYTSPAKLSTKNDVFSYGVLLLEMMSCRRAVDVEHEPAFLVEWARALMEQGRAAEICDPRIEPPDIDLFIRPVLDIASRCVSLKEHSRPSMKQVVAELKVVVNNVRFPLLSCFSSNGFFPWRRKRSSAAGKCAGVPATIRRSSKTGERVRRIICKNQEEEMGMVV
ncbi:serine/threonine-protein kinase-like protein At3g51990 [Nymphaea colorata]|uniref:Protein kinase domain-containing protein n=1 Tax=Nymphaea colorata TaxID=210225 RepID=A0A5K0Z064_9MAGN|nr:serine/threonine-protein kinase-like protein At3g51990 [Nymphaea colorata]